MTYELDWMTSNGLPKSASNTYLLSSTGYKQGAIVRTSYENRQAVREYLGKVSLLGFTYDVLKGTTWMGNEKIDGYTDGEIIRDVGREKYATIAGFFRPTDNTSYNQSSFISTSSIVGVRMMVAQMEQASVEMQTARNEIKVALDPAFEDERYQHEHFLQAKASGDIHSVSGLGAKEHIGKPLYFRNPSDDQDYIILPVMNLDETNPAAGKLLFLDRDGCPVTGGCPTPENAPPTNEFIVSFGDANNKFYPSHVETINVNGQTKLLIGGMGMVAGTRSPMMATIDVGSGSIHSALTNATPGTLCSMANCTLHVLSAQAAGTSMKDTASGMLYHNNEVWVSSLTKSDPANGEVTMYKSTLGASGFGSFTQVTLNTGNTAQDRVVSAVGDKFFNHNGVVYLPVCLSRTLPCTRTPAGGGGIIISPPPNGGGGTLGNSASLDHLWRRLNLVDTCYADEETVGGGIGTVSVENTGTPCTAAAQEDGKIYLYPASGTGSPIHIADHNYLCTTLQSVGNNLMVGGKLVTQVLHEEEILAVLESGDTPPLLYTDEIADAGSSSYADAYLTFNSAFPESTATVGGEVSYYGPTITWNSGTNVNVFNDGSLGVALGNRYIPSSGGNMFQQSVITMDMNPGGMNDRVVSNILTVMSNLNQSNVSSSFHEQKLNLSGDVVLPGVMYYSQSSPRTEVMPLPYIETAMSETKWFEFFLDYYDPKDRVTDTDYNIETPDETQAVCTNSIPASCGFGG
ncbi:MAG: hypothetical protein R3A45_01540 [Bdellovibrionota bacterium]